MLEARAGSPRIRDKKEGAVQLRWLERELQGRGGGWRLRVAASLWDKKTEFC